MMRDNTKCRKHRYIGKEIESTPYRSSLPLECAICGKMYFPEDPLCTRTVSNETINVCLKCKASLRCVLCRSRFDIKKSFIAECIDCGNIGFFCKKCSKKILTMPSKTTPRQEAKRKLKKILKEFYPELGGDFLGKIDKIKNFKGFKNIPGYLFIHFNIIFPEIFDAFQENDGADWWKNKS